MDNNAKAIQNSMVQDFLSVLAAFMGKCFFCI